jgi:acetyl-CoA carboxylase biotin carboxyl carrier protein
MEIHKIKQLIDVLAASDLAEIELTEGDHTVRLVRRLRADPVNAPTAQAKAILSASSGGPTSSTPADSPPGAVAAIPGDEWITAPLHGTMHLAPAPGAEPFVRPGDSVHPGQTLCMLEAMKMFHEVKAERKARVVAIVAANGHETEAGARLMQLTATD